jgi:hypothetical protein
MIKSKKERQRIIELIAPTQTGNVVENLRRITEEMPHITWTDIAGVAAVLAEECRMDAAEHEARADGRI